MPKRDGADPETDGSSSAVNGSVHFDSAGADSDASVDQVAEMEDEKSDYQGDGKVGDDAGKDEFVDAPEELNADNKDSAVISESEPELDERSSFPKSVTDLLEHGEPDPDLMDEIRRLQSLLEKTTAEKESTAREYEEERGRYTKEISELCHQIKGLTYRPQVFENGDVSANHHDVAESRDAKEKPAVSVISLHNMIRECSKLIGDALEERSQMEGSIIELHDTLYTKDQQIRELNSKISKLSATPNVQTEGYQHLEFVTRRILDSLAFVAAQEEAVEDSLSERLNLAERRTVALIEKYSEIYYQIDQLRQYLPETGSELLPDELGNVVTGACNELFEAKRKEVELFEKLKMVEVENAKLIEQLNKDKVALEGSNEELVRVRAELEQEKMRLANVKEKLSLAVTKGKSLVQQRDSLKHSLAEKTSELDRCTIDLQEKLGALEAAEATIEELRQNESLVALLQENLSQRNGILIKFEEVLSEASLPEEIRSLDITEKYRWLVDERNALKNISTEYQKCKDALSLVELPESVSNSDCESVVVRLRESFYQVKNEVETLQTEIAQTKDSAYNEIDRLTASLSAVLQEKDYLLNELDDLKVRYEETVVKENQVSSEKERMGMLLVEKSGVAASDPGYNYQGISFSDFSVLLDRCFERVRDNADAADCSPAELEVFERIKNLLYLRDLDLMLCEKVLEAEMLARSKEANDMSNELAALSVELSALKDERSSMLKDLERSEEKSSMLREKLSLAIKKGKGLVQDRENLKHLLDEKNEEIEKLKLEIQQQESVVTDCKDEISRMSPLVKQVPMLESELSSMQEQKDKLEQFLLESNSMLQRMIDSVENFKFSSGLTANDPAEKIKWLVASLAECRAAKNSVEQELSGVRAEADNLTARFNENVAAIGKMKMIEEDFEKVKEEAGSLTSQLIEAQATIKTLEDELSAAKNSLSQLVEERREIEVAKMDAERDLQEAFKEAGSLTSQLIEAQATIKALEDELSAANNSVSQLAEERREIEVAKMNAERDLQEAFKDASSQASNFAEACTIRKSLEDSLSQAESHISLLISEKEAGQAIRVDLETEREKMIEEISIQKTKLVEARETIKSLEEAMSELHGSVALVREDKAALENELKKLQDEAESKDSSLMDAFANIKLLEGALSKAENNISVLENENMMSNQQLAEVRLELNSCLEKLAGKSGNLEGRSLELIGLLNQLEVLVRDESLFSTMRRDFGKKFEQLKEMDLVLNSMKSQFSIICSEQDENGPAIMEGSVSDQLLHSELGDSWKFGAESASVSTVDGDNISMSFMKTAEGFHLKNKFLLNKFVEFSTFIDEILSVLFRKLEGRRDEVTRMVEVMESLKQDIGSIEIHKAKQENTMSMLEDTAAFLLSACTEVTKQLQFTAENKLLSLVSVPGTETQESNGIDAGEYRKKLDSIRYVKPVEDLLLAAGRVKGLIKQFEETTKAAATKIESLEYELNESQAACRQALEEGNSKQNKIYELEKDVETLENFCSSLKLREEDYQNSFEKLKEREEKISSLYNELLQKQQEAEDAFLSTSQWKALAEKIIGIEIPSVAISGRDQVADGSHAEKLFDIVDGFSRLQNQVDLLLQDKEELESNLAAKVLENKHLVDEVEMLSRHAQYSEKTKNDLSELVLGLEKMASVLGVTERAGEQKSAGANILLAALEKQVMNVIFEFEASKSRAQELGSKLLGSQKVIDELSAEVKLLEGSVQDRSLHPEVIQERGFLEAATPVPSGSEISEIEEDSAGKSLIPPVPSAAHVRTMRKGSTDHLALNIDAESQHLINTGSDDEKGHKFKSLNTSGLIPKQGKLVADRIDGICVNGGRILMSRPGARLGLIAYWLLLHIWLLGTLL